MLSDYYREQDEIRKERRNAYEKKLQEKQNKEKELLEFNLSITYPNCKFYMEHGCYLCKNWQYHYDCNYVGWKCTEGYINGRK